MTVSPAVIIQKIKGYPDGVGMTLPIRDESMAVIGYHRAFDRAHLSDDGLIRTMAECHTQCRENFLTQFVVTAENKKNWLENSVLPNGAKLLLLLETLEGRTIGQVGFTLFDSGGELCFSLDATMRWARGGHPDIVLRSVVERCAICFGLLGCVEGRAEFFADNALAVDRILMIGFEVAGEYGLRVSNADKKEEKVVYSKESDLGLINTDRRLIEVSIDRDRFAELHGRAIESPSWANWAGLF